MTDETENQPTTTDKPTVPTTPVTATDPVEDGTELQGGSAEAKAYRLKLRTSQAEAETLRGQVDALRRNEVLRLAVDHMADGADLLREHDVASLLDSEGNVDVAAVEAAIAETLEAHPHYAVRPGDSRRHPHDGLRRMHTNVVDPAAVSSASWADVLRS